MKNALFICTGRLKEDTFFVTLSQQYEIILVQSSVATKQTLHINLPLLWLNSSSFLSSFLIVSDFMKFAQMQIYKLK